MQKATIHLETLSCPSCMQKIENAVKGLNGIEKDSVKVLFNSSKVKANFDSEAVAIETIEKAIEDLGYPVIKSKVKAVA
ncbi:heavy-metal-associated domain-containing protein [Virgibacillus doumboii]|uniref:heavy-metal-associated domain-containing protein n=1 Tax=Virgibacillus doumboii TaxID=2697503 RepID=UPI0013DF962C|nr:heavy-metal-associated domain-containing protein [Virgibacillus doumboii]